MSSDGQMIVVLSCIQRLRRPSYFTNRGKKSAWKTWLAWPDITDSFATLSLPCTVNIPEDIILKLERFVVLVYCRTSDDMHVNKARMTLFSKMARTIENIPPTKAALEQHTRISSYQSGHVWGQSLNVQPVLPDVTDWGWETSQTADYIPKWTTSPISEIACHELISCKCYNSSRGIASVSRQTWNAPHFANMVGPAINRRRDL